MKNYELYIATGGMLHKFNLEADGCYKDGETYVFFIEKIEGVRKTISVFPICKTIINKINIIENDN